MPFKLAKRLQLVEHRHGLVEVALAVVLDGLRRLGLLVARGLEGQRQERARDGEADATAALLEAKRAKLQQYAAQKRADDVEREREITPEEVRQAKKAEADEARARGDSDVREAKRAKTEPAASDPDAQKALDVQKKRVAQLEDQLGTATEEKLFAKSAADAATTAHAALLAQKARAVATARSEDPETRAKFFGAHRDALVRVLLQSMAPQPVYICVVHTQMNIHMCM